MLGLEELNDGKNSLLWRFVHFHKVAEIYSTFRYGIIYNPYASAVEWSEQPDVGFMWSLPHRTSSPGCFHRHLGFRSFAFPFGPSSRMEDSGRTESRQSSIRQSHHLYLAIPSCRSVDPSACGSCPRSTADNEVYSCTDSWSPATERA